MARARIRLPLLVSLLAIGAVAPTAQAETGPCIPGTTEPTCQIWKAKVFATADGDTFNAKIWEDGGWSRRQDIRLLGVQAMELTNYSRARGREGDCHAVAAAERLEDLLQGPKTERRIVRLAAFSGSSTTGGERARLRRGVAYKQGGGWRDAATTLVREGHALWGPNRKEWAWNAPISKVAAEAARKRIGIWDSDACGAGPSQEVPFAMKVKWDASGRDGSNVNGEWVRIRNAHPTSTVSLEGWWIRDAYLREYEFREYKFPTGAVLPPRASMIVHVGSGTDTATDLFWGEPDPIFENVQGGPLAAGDGAYLFDPQGDLRAYVQYPCQLDCTEPLSGKVAISARPKTPESVTVTNISAEIINLYQYEIENVPYFFEFGPFAFLRPGQSVTVDIRREWIPFPLSILRDATDVVSLRNPLGAPFACTAWGGATCPTF